jgi:hypothetical protein
VCVGREKKHREKQRNTKISKEREREVGRERERKERKREEGER